MPCFKPRHVHYHPTKKTDNGKMLIVFNARDAAALIPISLPCGQCTGCRLERSRQWAMRVMHEAQLHENNCFITLTYDDDHLPPYNSLDHRDFQLFMKKLRRRLGSRKVRFYMCGEYGEQFGRPHFHACLFGFDFPDKTLFRTDKGTKLFRSKFLESLWPNGYSSIGTLTFNSAAYVSRYIMKKRTGPSALDHYEILDEYGEYRQRTPEYNKPSLKPGIGKNWFEKNLNDVYPHDYVVVNGNKTRPPKYYDRAYELAYPSDYEDLKHQRYLNSKNHAEDNTDERLAVREIVALSKLTQLKRTLK